MCRTTSISVSQAHSGLSDLIGRARYGNERLVIEGRGALMAVLVGMGAGEHSDISEHTDEFLAKADSPEAND